MAILSASFMTSAQREIANEYSDRLFGRLKDELSLEAPNNKYALFDSGVDTPEQKIFGVSMLDVSTMTFVPHYFKWSFLFEMWEYSSLLSGELTRMNVDMSGRERIVSVGIGKWSPVTGYISDINAALSKAMVSINSPVDPRSVFNLTSIFDVI